MMRFSAPLLALSLLALAGPAAAQLDSLTDPLPRTLDEKSDKRLDRVEQTLREMRAILYQGRDTGKAVVAQPAETQGQLEVLTSRVNDLEATLRRLNGQIDQASTDIAAVRRDQQAAVAAQQAANAQNVKLQARLDNIDKQLAALINAQKQEQAAVTADPGKAMDQAMQLYSAGQYRAASAAFQSYVDSFGDRDDAAEARYYLGESLYKQADYTNAANAYIGAIRGWPKTDWAPDAVVKLSLSLIELRKNPDACGILSELNSRYPKTPAALKAEASRARTRARCS